MSLLKSLSLAFFSAVLLSACGSGAASSGKILTTMCAQPGHGQAVTTPSGLKYEDLVVGTGAEARPGNNITANYVGTLVDGTEFDNSYTRGQALPLTLGAGQVIPGWDEGIVGMKVGGKRCLTIPPQLGYGAQGSPPKIPANATLIFEVELMSVK